MTHATPSAAMTLVFVPASVTVAVTALDAGSIL